MKLGEVYVSATQYAGLRGVDATYIHHLRRNGRLVVDEQGRIAVRESDALIARTRQRRPRRGSVSAQPNHPWGGGENAAPAADSLADLPRIVAATLQNAALALAPRVAGVTDVAACRALLAQELNRVAAKITTAALTLHRGADAEGPGLL